MESILRPFSSISRRNMAWPSVRPPSSRMIWGRPMIPVSGALRSWRMICSTSSRSLAASSSASFWRARVCLAARSSRWFFTRARTTARLAGLTM